jgi:uncharacterized repeat protein (TIGR03803 family)
MNQYCPTFIGTAFCLISLVITIPGGLCAQTFEILHAFSGPDGSYPTSRILEASDGSLYGVTSRGGPNDIGTIFRLDQAGLLSTMAFFSRTNGYTPYTGLTAGSDGHFYGVASYGGPTNTDNWSGYGTFFKLDPKGSLTTLAYFDYTNGGNPYAELTQGTDGNFYGTTTVEGGTIIRISPAGVITNLHWFNYTDGASPKWTRWGLARRSPPPSQRPSPLR